MKKIEELAVDFDTFSKNVIQNLLKAEKETALAILERVIIEAPATSGEYISSISIDDPILEENTIKTIVGTDMKSEDGFFIGRMIENGTGIYALEQHIGKTKTFIESGYTYWYLPKEKAKRSFGTPVVINGKEFYVMYPQPAKPHFVPAYNACIRLRKENISKAIKESVQ